MRNSFLKRASAIRLGRGLGCSGSRKTKNSNMKTQTPSHIPVTFSGSMTAEYLELIRQHVIRPLRDTAVAESCFGAAMLIFGAVDGLGRLIHRNAKAGAGERFCCFLPRLGQDYSRRKAALWRLRNSLAHNSMNVASFMSKTEDAQGQHLEDFEGYLFVHTKKLLEHFETAVAKLETEFRTDADLLARAESRLHRAYIPWSRIKGRQILTTQPPPVEFIQLKKPFK